MQKITTAALAVAALLALPVAANASVPFGSQLTHEPANGPGLCGPQMTAVPCTFVGYRHPTPPAGDNVPSPAPFDGVVTKLRVRSATPDQVTFAFATITAQDESATASLGALGPAVTLAGTGEIEEYPAQVSVKKGVQVALQGTSFGAVYDSNGGKDSFEFTPPLTLGGAPQDSTGYSGGELLVQAILEPDVDHDGLGDESQDTRVTSSGPRLTRVKMSGKKLRYKLSEAAKVTVRISRHGTVVKRITRTGHTGANAIKINRGSLSSGRYRVSVSARDADNLTSATKRVALRISH
ncbi:MAG: hypothetical protein QOG15_1831 [Solirubrobacteraceae bacterium]|jgi:hypothetical protein|nr:hypothetical protein [Solirubrobacteraceae bacterium]